MKSVFTTIKVDDISFPFILKNKSGLDEKMTIANIVLIAKVQKEYRIDFRKEVTNIINSCVSDWSLNKLLTLLLKYVNSIHALKAEIICKYPFFIFRQDRETEKGFLKKFTCTLSLKKQSLLKYKKKFCIEVPVIRKTYRVPGYESNIAEISTNLLVEMEGFETFNAEDIAETIEKYSRGNAENYTTRLGANIKNELLAKYSVDNCTVKLVDRKIQKMKLQDYISKEGQYKKNLKQKYVNGTRYNNSNSGEKNEKKKYLYNRIR